MCKNTIKNIFSKKIQTFKIIFFKTIKSKGDKKPAQKTKPKSSHASTTAQPAAAKTKKNKMNFLKKIHPPFYNFIFSKVPLNI